MFNIFSLVEVVEEIVELTEVHVRDGHRIENLNIPMSGLEKDDQGKNHGVGHSLRDALHPDQIRDQIEVAQLKTL